MRDFNEIMNADKKYGGAPVDVNICYQFRNWVEDYQHLDMGASRPKFTWKGQESWGYGRIYK